jgi:glycosyltransferase involved in cell wall biosynthesis
MTVSRLSIVIPVYNEKDTIEEVIATVQALEIPLEKEIVLVDDSSVDGSRDIVRGYEGRPGMSVWLQDKNRGKGAAIRKGFELATGDVVIVQDADLEYNPADIPTVIGPILRDEADVVYGSRFTGGPHRVLYFWHTVGNKFLTLVSNMLSNLNLTDMEVGYKAFRKEVLDRLELESDRFGIEVEMTARVAKMRVRIYEVPISYRGRTYEEGKKITWRDGLAAFWHIIRFNLLTRAPK